MGRPRRGGHALMPHDGIPSGRVAGFPVSELMTRPPVHCWTQYSRSRSCRRTGDGRSSSLWPIGWTCAASTRQRPTSRRSL